MVHVKGALYLFYILNMKILLLLSVLCLSVVGSYSQDANAVLQKAVAKIKSVKDYQASVDIILDVDFIKAPNAKGMMYFKQPNKFRLKSDDIAMLPKQGLKVMPLSFLQNGDYDALPAGTALYNGVQCTVVKVIPRSDSSDVVASKMYIDPTTNLILKSENTTKKNGTLTIMLEYGSAKQYGLPSKMTVTFDVPEFKLPKSMSGDISGSSKENKPKRTTGSVIIECKDYKINKGLDDSVFK